ncbi:MAG: MBL fold metallo-hydrolase, partial [Oscillospiraceae bacterium]|nr:MBL fold metallo-hydrolase [Oscillospiraceae bacterium]
MTKRFLAFLLTLAMLCALVPAVFAAPTPASTVNLTAELSYSLKGLKFNSVIQNFYIDTDYIYITQNAGSGTFYLSRLKISGTTATYVDHMTLTNCGNGESLAGYHYNGKLYFYIGAKGLEASSYGSTQIARVEYKAGASYTYTDLTRFIHLSCSTADGTSVGTANRVACAANELFTTFRIQTTDNSVTYSCYYTEALNKALDSTKMLGMETTSVLNGFIYSFTQTQDNRVLPNNSFQGMELANSDMILVCGGNAGETPAIARMSQNGTYQSLANITNIGTTSTGPIGIKGDRVYIASVPASDNVNGQKLYSILGSKMGVPAAVHVPATLGYTLTGLKFTSVIQNFYIDTDYLYITQSNSTGTQYLSRLKIEGTTATYVDHMTLTECGNGESLAGYRYNGKLYFFVGAKGLAATSYGSTQIARVQYEPGKTYTYTDLNRFYHLANSTASGATLGSAVRVACGGDENYTVIRIELDDGTTCYTCYDTKTLNKALDSGKLIAMESTDVRSGFVYHFKQKKAVRVIPNNSFQGVELANLNAILLSGGNTGETPAVAKMNKNGTYERLAYITNLGTSATGPIEYLNDRLYIVCTSNNKIYYIGGDKLGITTGTAASYTTDAPSVLEAASYMKANMDAKVLPSTVTIGEKACTDEQFLDLACKLLLNIVNGTPNETLSFSDVSAASSPSGADEGTVLKEDYISMARSIVANIDSFRRAPNYTTSSSIGKMQHSYCVYMYAFLLDYYVRYGMLPEAYAVLTWAGTTATPIAPQIPGVSALDTAAATTVHQLPSVVPDAETGDYMQNLSIVIRTKEGKTIVIDGGRKSYDSDYLFKYLQRVTGDSTPHVDAWFMTHAHSDHYGAIIGIANKYASQITVDAFYHRFPTEAQVNKYFAAVEPATRNSQIQSILTAVGKFKNAKGGPTNIVTLNAIHTGKCNSSFDFDDLHVDVLLTIEDIFWAADNITTKYTATWEKDNANHENQTPKQLVSENFNNSSTVFRLTAGGKTLMVTGDAATVSTIMLERYHKSHASDSSKYYSIKTDMVTMAHHGARRGLSKAVYKLIDPNAVLWPVPKAGINNGRTDYPLQWIAELGSTTYFSYEGPQVFTFAPKRSATATSIPEELKLLVFDAEYYADRYPELKAAYGTDEAQLYSHFVNYGIEEGRSASPYFDVRFYMNNNGEGLREHCHGDYNVAFAHFLKYVYDANEKKTAPKLFSPLFDCKYYGSTYSDLASMTTEFQLLQHFATVGDEEGRLGSQGFLAEDGITYHKRSTRVVTEASCSTPGSIKFTCSDCGYSCTATIATTDHSVVIDEAVAATCTSSGLTEGSHCSICNTVLVAQEAVAPLGHNYSYTDLGDSHTGTCSRCDAVVTEGHTFADGTCICGKAEVQEPQLDESLKINHTLNLASDISVNFAVAKSLLADFDLSTVYLECAMDIYEGNNKTGSTTVKLLPVDQGSYYYFTLTGLTAVQMNDRLSSVLYGSKNGQPYYSPMDSYSVADYAYSQLNKEGSTATLKTLCADLLRYGSCAQSFKGY